MPSSVNKTETFSSYRFIFSSKNTLKNNRTFSLPKN
ncbi:hypothetical protein CF65_01375 [Aggregatibacter actinomycetemcomitans HK1651]|nr:hypothetical protein CF65_01375 [Aggregatibacter actinomycetemcomitans HK1651]